MTAVNVYGVALGSQFKSADGSTVLTVTEFITPKTMLDPWEARVTTDTGIPAIIEVKDLLGSGYERVTKMRVRDFYEMIGENTSPDDFIQVITPQGTNVEVTGLIRDSETNIAYIQTYGG